MQNFKSKIMIPHKRHDFQINVERPIVGVYGDRQDQIFPESNQYMSFDFSDVVDLVETGASMYNSTQAANAAKANASAVKAAKDAAAKDAAAKAANTPVSYSPSGGPIYAASTTPKWIFWAIGGVVLVGGIITTIVLVTRKK